MDKLKIYEQKKLKGSIKIPGSKNSSLPILACTLLTDKDLVLNNIPKLVDIETMKKLLKSFGVNIKKHKNDSLILSSKKIHNFFANYDLVRKMRASILVLGPLLARFKKADISLPGGCAIGSRPVNLHLQALEKLGVKFKINNGYINARVEKFLKGNNIIFPSVSVGATTNTILAAVLARGKTTILNAAKEPEIVDLANCLNKMGALIEGMGTSIIKINGVKKLNGTHHSIIPDRIVACTFIIAAVMLNQKFVIKNLCVKHLKNPIKILKKIGANIIVKEDYIKVNKSNFLNAVKIKTMPYPGFPTDLQAQFMALLSIANGKSFIKETIFENRFMHVPELNRLGADIEINNDTAIINGNRKFVGTQLMASDLRASVSLVLAGLCASGETTINRLYHLDRGYEKIEETLGKCGPKIKRIK